MHWASRMLLLSNGAYCMRFLVNQINCHLPFNLCKIYHQLAFKKMTSNLYILLHLCLGLGKERKTIDS